MSFKIIKTQIGRLDKVLALALPEYSRSLIDKLIENGKVTVNKGQAKSSYRVKEMDVVAINVSQLEQKPSEIHLPIIYEDEDALVINKPAGILTHAKGDVSHEATVATFISSKLNGDKQWASSNRAGIVHRLDRATSGVIICAKNEVSYKYLQKQFANRTVKKTYLALVDHDLPSHEGLIDIPIERNPKKPATFRAGINGKPAQTYFKVKKTKSGRSLVELKPTTGRTHQLRVHLAHLKSPIIGDELYGGTKSDRLLLHAAELELTLPGGKRTTFVSPVPKEFI